MVRRSLLIVSAALALVMAGCRPRTVSFDVRLITVSCDPAPGPMDSVTHFKFRVFGDGLKPIEKVTAVTPGQLDIPEIPSGKNRQVEVRAYAGNPGSGGQLVSLGRTLPFDVPDVVPEDAPKQPEIPIFLRRVNEFSHTASTDAPSTCTRMRDARAGMTATLLNDGRVYIAAGFQMNGTKRTAIHTAEIYSPSVGDFVQAKDVGFVSPNQVTTASNRAFHTATLLNNGQVLLIGGEAYDTTSGDAAPTKLGLIYDPDFNDYGVFVMQTERTHHAAAKESGGRVLIVGGYDRTGKVVGPMEWYDPNEGKTLPVKDSAGNPVQMPRVGHSVAAIQGGSFITVAGGSDGTALNDEVDFFKWDDASQNFVAAANNAPHLREARRDAALVPFQDGNTMVMAGGFDAAQNDAGNPIASTELFKTGLQFTISDGPTLAAPRGDICAAQLPDGRVVTIGGFVNDAVAGSHSDPTVELLTPSDTGAPTSFRPQQLDNDARQSRHFHTCTTLKDGTVLVLGGLHVEGGTTTVLQDALIFTPAPID